MTRSSRDDILRAFLAGDEATHATVRGWIEAVVRFRRWRFRDPEGLVQEVLLKLLDITRTGRFRRTSGFKTFVYSVAEHTCIDTYRYERLRERLERSEDMGSREYAGGGNDPEQAQVERERGETVRYIFQRLSEGCRSLWIWVYRDGMKATEVASRLGISPGNARVRVHRCLKEAREIAEEYLPGGAL